ncbi:MAG: 2Fe-2S iron-sulfur cluster-binding protein, partial [Candidatus Aminicenantes bacterium]|nr:2Fe-2S iron-sulfur cluster-binding protein [Candidatus Aminicenantes bacterium]
MAEKKSRTKKKECQVAFSPFEVSVEVPSGSNLLDAVKTTNLPLKATCGGKGTCGDCVVRILSGPYHSKPAAALPDHLASQGYALSCQTTVRGNLSVELPQFRELSIQSIVDSKFFRKERDKISGTYELDPAVKKISLQIPPATLDDSFSDLKRIERQLQKKLPGYTMSCEYSVLKKLARAVRKDSGKINVIISLSEGRAVIIDAVPPSEDRGLFSLACDIGTTTVALHLVDLQNGKIAATATSLNQQITCGEDVISRIVYSQKPGRLKKLHELIILTINNLIEKVVTAARISSDEICFGSFSGNTTMTHLFLNLDPRYIREEPYVPTLNQVPAALARDLGLKMHPEARIHCSPAVGSYVGGDITAGLLCTP